MSRGSRIEWACMLLASIAGIGLAISAKSGWTVALGFFCTGLSTAGLFLVSP